MLSLFQSDNDSLDRCAPHHGRNPYSRVYTYNRNIQIFIVTRGCIPPPRIQQGTHTTVTSRYVQIQGGAYPPVYSRVYTKTPTSRYLQIQMGTNPPPRIQQGVHIQHQHLDIYRYKGVHTPPLCNSGYKQSINIQIYIYLCKNVAYIYR